MGKKYDYFAALNKQAQLSVKAAEILIEAINGFKKHHSSALAEPMRRVHEIEHEGDTINHNTINQVARDFITPIDREDIVELSHAFDCILDRIEDVVRLFYIYDVQKMHDSALDFATIILNCCKALVEATEEFRNFKKPTELHKKIVMVNDYEEAGDELYMKAIRGLYKNHTEVPMRVIVWSRIFDSLEKTCDCCESAADVLAIAVLKNS